MSRVGLVNSSCSFTYLQQLRFGGLFGNSGDTESVEESDENEGMHYNVKYICMPPKKHLPPKCNEIVSEEFVIFRRS